MKKIVRRTAIAIATVVATVAIASTASAFQYLISPTLTKDTTYSFGQCRVAGKGTGTVNLTVYVVHHNSCYMDMIGGRAIGNDGTSTAITWDYARDDVINLTRASKVASYKVYKTVGDF